MNLTVISSLLRGVGLLASNPALGTGAAVGVVANLAATLIDLGAAGEQGLTDLNNQVQDMVTAGRNPNPDEWDSLKARSDAAHAAIQGLDSAAQATAPPAPVLQPQVKKATPVAPKPVPKPIVETAKPVTSGQQSASSHTSVGSHVVGAMEAGQHGDVISEKPADK